MAGEAKKAEDPLVGTTVGGRYEVKERLARGGMGYIYHSVQIGLGRNVALKVMHAEEDEDAAAEFAKRMLNEAEEGGTVDPDRAGLARELARMNLTLNVYTQWYWKVDLHNLLHFLSLRADPHAQYEIRVYADAMMEAVRRWVPMVHDAFVDYRLGAATLSGKMLGVVRRMLDGETVEQAGSGLGAREWRELMAVLGR